MSAEVYLSGNAKLSFKIKSDGLAAAAAKPSACTSPSTDCTPDVIIPTVDLPTITVSGVTIKPIVSLSAAGVSSFVMPEFKLQLGMSASVVVKLGGKVTFNGISSGGVALAPIIKGYGDFAATYSGVPFKLSGFTNAAGSIDVTIIPNIRLVLWGFLGFKINPRTNFKYSLATTTSRRALRDDQSSIEEHAFARRLDSCVVGALSATSATAGAVGVYLEQVRLFELVKAASGWAIETIVASAFNGVLLPATLLLNPATATFETALAVSASASACMTVGRAIDTTSEIAATPTSTPSPTPGAVAGGVVAAAKAAAAACDVACYVPIIILVPLGLAIIGFLLKKYYFDKKKAVVPAPALALKEAPK
jgi:hypothetical protein